jgi:hypothetical protein
VLYQLSYTGEIFSISNGQDISKLQLSYPMEFMAFAPPFQAAQSTNLHPFEQHLGYTLAL